MPEERLKTLAEAWQGYVEDVLHEAPPGALPNLSLTFYAGAIVAHEILSHVVTDNFPDLDVIKEQFNLLDAENKDFRRQFWKKYGETT